jgi:DNA repair and recombination protein RAD52
MTPEQIKMLEAPLNAAHVKKPSGSFGPKGDYLEGWHVINELNRIFGFDGWSYNIALTKDALERDEVKGQWQAAYTCVCTLTVGDVTRQDVGFGSGFAKMVGDAIEGATKEAATDALKRCARTFGNPFGLALYDKSRVNVEAAKVDPNAKISDTQRDWLIGKAEASVGVAELCKHFGKISLKDFTVGELEPARDWLKSPTAKAA